MISFKSFLLEYLTDVQRKHFSQYKMSDKARADTDHFFGAGNDKVTGDLNHMTDKSEIHRKVEKHLGKAISHEDYRAGLTTDNYGRDVKIGRAIKDDQLRAEYARDPTREGAKAGSQYTTSTVRGVEVAGQTNSSPNAEHPNGHSWKELSCKNVRSGIQRHKLPDEIHNGTVVHFVHDHNGQEIYRATLQPHHNEEGHVAYDIDAEYGIKHPSFTKSARDVADALTGPLRGSPIYEKHPEVYNDSGTTHMLHPSTDGKQLADHMKSTKFTTRMAVLRHRNVTPELVDAGVKDQNRNVRREAAKSRLLTPQHIDKIVNNPQENGRVKIEAISNPNATHDQISRGLEHEDPDVRFYALKNPNVTADHIAKAIKPNQPFHVREAALGHRRANSTHINEILNTRPPRVMDRDTLRLHQQAAAHPKASSENLHKALDSEDPTVRELAINNNNATMEHIERGLNDPHPSVRQAARYAKKVRE